MVITQEPNQRYVQLMIGHGHAHLEASSGVMGFDEPWPVTIDVFGADSPCETCFGEA